MDASRTEAYLRAACTVLGFEIGELWCAKVNNGRSPSLRFLQLYTSPRYKDEHNLLVRPNTLENQKEGNHQFSPMICRCVCEGGQIVWANTRALKGLTGRKDLALNSAVGVPACTVGNDLVILVLYAVRNIQMNPTSVEILCSIARIAAMGGGGFLPASQNCEMANTENFVGVWDMLELIKRYVGEVKFHLLPLSKMNQFFDYQEYSTIKEVLNDKKLIAQTTERAAEGTDKEESPLLITADGYGGEGEEGSSEHKSGDGRQSRKHSFDESFLTTAESDSVGESNDMMDGPVMEAKGESDQSANYISASLSYKKNQTQMHEFMMALLGMSSFEIAELWFVSERSNPPEMYVAAALHQGKEQGLKKWTQMGKTLRLRKGVDIIGQAFKESRPCLDEKYNEHTGEPDIYPRGVLAAENNIRTAFAVPLPGHNAPGGVLVVYGTTEVSLDPVMVGFVLKASHVLLTNVWDPNILNVLDVESITTQPKNLLVEWVAKSSNSDTLTIQPTSTLVDGDTRTLISSMNINTPSSTIGIGLPINDIPDAQSSSVKELGNPFSIKFNLMGSLGGGGGPSVDSFDPLAEVGTSGRAKRKTAVKDEYVYWDSGAAATSSSSSSSSKASSSRTKVCRSQNCSQPIIGRSPFCPAHSDTRRCQYPDCTKCAQGATKFCIGHGGGRRCTHPGCSKGARDKFFCAAHGGGKRCMTMGCTKSAVGGSGLCTAHGGGKRCQVPGCTKSSQSSTNFCVKHGGGRKCMARGCTKVARGKTDYCASHGGKGESDLGL